LGDLPRRTIHSPALLGAYHSWRDDRNVPFQQTTDLVEKLHAQPALSEVERVAFLAAPGERQ
jgi:hypothetical protein